MSEEEKKQVVAEGTRLGPWTISNIEEMQSIFTVETEKACYVANDLDSAMRLWMQAAQQLPGAEGLEDDETKVINVRRLG